MRSLLQGGIVILASTAVLATILAIFLPFRPITQATFQTYTAPAAYLKDTIYFFPLALIYMLPTYHSVVTRRRLSTVAANSPSDAPATRILHLSPSVLGWLFVVLLAASLWMMTHLLDNLVPAPGMLLFQVLLWVKLAIFVCLILEILWWYKQELDALKASSSRTLAQSSSD